MLLKCVANVVGKPVKNNDGGFQSDEDFERIEP